jgi:hypothetical protein
LIREALIGSRPVSDVGLVCSLRQGYAGLRSAAMPVSRMLLDVSVHHIFLLDEDITAAALRDCRVIILPQTRMLSNPQIEALRAYFEGGGNLVVLGDCGTLDEYARRRADGLMRLVGTAATSREVFRGESGGRRMVYIPTEKLPKLPATGREEIAGDLGEIQKAVTWAAHDLLPCRNPLPCQVEVHLAKKRSGEAEVLLAHIVNYQVDLAGKVSPVDDLKIKVLVPEGCRVTGVRSLSGQQGLSAEMEAASGRSYVVVKIPRLLIYDLVEIDVIRSKKESPG